MANYNMNPNDTWNALGDSPHVQNYYDSKLEYNNLQAQPLGKDNDLQFI